MQKYSRPEQTGFSATDSYHIPPVLLLKKTLFIGLPFMLIAFVVIITFYHAQISTVETNTRALSEYDAQNLAQSLTRLIRNITGDAQLIASHPLLEAALSDPDGAAAQQLSQEWKVFAAQKRIYDQIRLLSSNGQEQLRINLSPDGAIAVPRGQLQNKANRYYFREAMTLDPGQIYLSPLDLNVEHGRIEQPLKPMLRIGIPIADRQGRKVGLVVLNNLASTLLANIGAHNAMSNTQALLLNEEGFYLHGFRAEDEWAFMYPGEQRPDGRFSSSFPAIWAQINQRQSGQALSDKGLFSYQWITTEEGGPATSPYVRRFVVVSAITAARMAALKRPYYQVAWVTAAFATLAILIISSLASRYRLRELFAVQRLREAEGDQRVILETVGEGIIGVNASAQLTFVNSRVTELTGYKPDEMMGKEANKVIILQDLAKNVPESDYCPIQQCLSTVESCRSDSDVLRRKNGVCFPVEYLCNPISRDGTIIGAVVSFLDITERKNAERHIQHLALYDALTDIPNRTLLLDRLKQQIANARRTNRSGALLYVDIDRFRQINDALGHSRGNDILIEVAKRLCAIAQEGETVARISSDEFVLLKTGSAISMAEAAHDALLVAHEIMLALEQPFQANGEAIRLTTSIGITTFPNVEEDAAVVLAKADAAAVSAKQAGRNTSRFFTADLESDTKGWLNFHNRLLEAVANDAFTLVYQPLVRHNANAIGLEALLRWDDPILGEVSPSYFIPIAEKDGLILQLSDFVLSNVCGQVRVWLDAGLGEAIGHVAVNISPTQFAHKDFVDYVHGHLERAGIPPHTIELEITERTLVADIVDTRIKIQRLRELGIGVSIDDFGTGYSSLSYLQQLPIDRLKIDRSFVTDVDKSHDQQTIVEAIIKLANGFSLKVIAEGVESEEEMRYLLNTGCHEFQGYYFFHPMSASELTDLLKRESILRHTPEERSS